MTANNSQPHQEDAPTRSWIERLGDAFHRDLKDRHQLIELLRVTSKNHVIDAESLSMLEGVLQVSEMQVRDTMIPKSKMVAIELNAPLDSVLPAIIDSGHSRFPVIHHEDATNQEKVDGILLAKDLLSYCYKNNNCDTMSIEKLIRPAVFVPESKRLNILLREFQSNRQHMAIVVDEYDSISGLITIEDVLEQIVGEIEDEFDSDDSRCHINQLSHDSYTVNALTPIEEFNIHFNTNFSHQDLDTIGGLVAQQFGHLPKRGERIEIGGLQFKILHANQRRIRLMRVTHTIPDNAH